VIAHISDLHVGGEFFSERLAKNLIKYLSSLRPDIVVVTGDITDYGYVHEYERAVDLLSSLECSKLIVVPGNHDARNLGYMVFEEAFGTRYPFLEYDGVCIQGVDSSEPDIDDGHIGRLAYEIVRQNLNKCKGLKIVALHHHLVPIPWTGRERNIPFDAGDFLYLLSTLNVGMVLSGHKHVPWLWNLNNTLILHAGTATTLRLKAGIHPSINVIHVNERQVKVIRVSMDTLEERMIFQRPLPNEVSAPLLGTQDGHARIRVKRQATLRVAGALPK